MLNEGERSGRQDLLALKERRKVEAHANLLQRAGAHTGKRMSTLEDELLLNGREGAGEARRP